VTRLKLSDVQRQVLRVLRHHEWRELRFFHAELEVLKDTGLVRLRKGEELWKAKLTDTGETQRLWLELIRRRPELENAVIHWPDGVGEARLVYHRETRKTTEEEEGS